MTSPADLASDTAVIPIPTEPGRYRVDLPTSWSYRHPSGGVVMTAGLRAMQVELGRPELALRSATTTFASPVYSGRTDVRVRVIRRGRTAAQVHARVASPGDEGPGCEILATFTRRRRGPTFRATAWPEGVSPPPTEGGIDDELDPARLAPFFQQFDSRLALGHHPWRGDWAPGAPIYGRWYRYRIPQRDADGRLDALAVPPVADTMPPAVFMRLGPDGPPIYAPSLDLTIHWLQRTKSEWLLALARSRWAGAGYAAGDIEVWDADGKLVAVGSQTMLLSSMGSERRSTPKRPAPPKGSGSVQAVEDGADEPGREGAGLAARRGTQDAADAPRAEAPPALLEGPETPPATLEVAQTGDHPAVPSGPQAEGAQAGDPSAEAKGAAPEPYTLLEKPEAAAVLLERSDADLRAHDSSANDGTDGGTDGGAADATADEATDDADYRERGDAFTLQEGTPPVGLAELSELLSAAAEAGASDAVAADGEPGTLPEGTPKLDFSQFDADAEAFDDDDDGDSDEGGGGSDEPSTITDADDGEPIARHDDFGFED